MSGDKYNDRDIIKGIITLDPKIYEYLDEKYREEVIQHVRRNSGSTEDGEEHYQDTIFEVYINIDEGKYDSNSSRTFHQHLWLIVKRRWLDKLRKMGRILRTDELDELLKQIPDKDETEEIAQNIYNKLALLINKYLLQLTDEERKYIKLYYDDSESLQFIADYFGKSYGYVQQKLHKIREKLRRMIKDDPEFRLLFT